MAIRLPLYTVLDYNNTTIQGGGPASVAGGVSKPFQLPQDTDNVVVKFQASVLAGGASAVLQTSDDGGTTWYDVGRTSIVSNANLTTAEWLSAPVIGAGIGAPPVQTTASIFVGGIGSAAASTLSAGEMSGMPILGIQGRVFIRYSNAVTSIISERVTVMVNSQSATA